MDDPLATPTSSSKDVGMGTFVLALTLGILARAYLSSLLRLPYTCLVLLFGLAYGFILYTEVGVTGPDIFSVSSDLWTNLSPEAILTVILPILIFGSSFSSDLHLFLQQLSPVLTLAGPAVLVNTALLGLTAKYVLPYGWDWTTSFMVGSMLSATDPVAVVAILKTLGVAESLSILIDGESLLNDGFAIVLYSIFNRLVLDEEKFSPLETMEAAVVLCFGGPAIGIVVGVVASYVLGVILNDPASEITGMYVAWFVSLLSSFLPSLLPSFLHSLSSFFCSTNKYASVEIVILYPSYIKTIHLAPTTTHTNTHSHDPLRLRLLPPRRSSRSFRCPVHGRRWALPVLPRAGPHLRACH